MNFKNTNFIKSIYFYILAAIYLFNDFVFIYTTTITSYLIFDYLFRIISLVIIIYLIKIKIISFSYLKLNLLSFRAFLFWSLYLVFVGLIIFFILEEILLKILPDIHFFNYPKYDNSYSKIIDLTFGLIIVALTEELIFRGYCYSYLTEKGYSYIKIVVISSIIFGLIHWSVGITAIITTGLWGIFTIVSVKKTDSIYPALLAHYLLDLISFSEIIPKINI
jgi:uncharacterized protein